MIAADSSTIVAYLGGAQGRDVELFDAALLAADVSIPPVALTEVLSDPTLPAQHRNVVLRLPVLEIEPDHWTRAAATRATILARRLRARLADTLIAQACIDHGIPLITRDLDFRPFAKHCGLRLA
jgi:predicted nucleic acid-binding protein